MSHGLGTRFLFVTTLMQIFSFGKKIEIVIARPYENMTICEPPLITMLTSSLVPFVGPVEIGLENVGRYVCLKNTSDIGVFIRLLALEQPLHLEIKNSTLIHLQPTNITCSLVLWQSRDTLENIITIKHGATLVSRKEFFRHEKRLDMRVQTVFRPSFHDGNLFRCQWSLKEIWGSSWVKKDVEVVFQKRSIIIPATNVRPSTIDAKIGQPIKCLYDGSETDQIAWNMVDKGAPHHVIEGTVKDILRVMEVGEFEVVCEVNSTQEIGDLWKGKLKISSHDFSNSNLPLSYAFALQYGQTVLNSPFCQSNSMVYWLTQSHHVAGVIEKVEESHAGIYGCLIGFDVVGLVRLVVLKQNLTLTIPRSSFITDEIVELNCSVSAWFGRGRITSQLELYQSDGTSLKNIAASVQDAEILNLHAWYNLRADLGDSGRKFVCRWSLSEMIRDMEEIRSSFVVEDSFQVWNIIRPSNIRPNVTTTYVDMVVLCSNEARPEEICTWKSLEPVAIHVKPMWSFLGAALVIHKTGTFAFQCRCVDPELNRETNLPWAGEIRILARGGIKSLGMADAQLVYVSSVAKNLKAEYGFLAVRILQVITAFDEI